MGFCAPKPRTARRGRRSGGTFEPNRGRTIRNDYVAAPEAHSEISITRWQRSTPCGKYGSKHGPTYRVWMEARSYRAEECEMNFRNNLTAFSRKGAAANRGPVGLSDGLGDSSATVAADRAPPAAVAELGRCSAAAADSLVRKKKRTTEVPAKKNKSPAAASNVPFCSERSGNFYCSMLFI